MSNQAEIGNLFEKLVAGDRVALGKCITLVESKRPEHRASAIELLNKCLEVDNPSFRFAVSGAPGVGKSTLIEVLGEQIVDDGHKLAVLAIDPTSPVSHGAILGDKTRMETLSRHPDVFVRPTSAGTTLGGVADRTREVIALCEAAGYDRICVETVGVGQSETDVHYMTDFFLLLVLPGGGDDLQGIKKGIVEMADLIVVNKCDGPHREAAKLTQRHYAQATHFFAPKDHGGTTRVMTCSALEGKRIENIRTALKEFEQKTRASGFHHEHRASQNVHWLETRTRQFAQESLLSLEVVQAVLEEAKSGVAQSTESVSSALGRLEQIILTSIHKSDNA